MSYKRIGTKDGIGHYEIIIEAGYDIHGKRQRKRFREFGTKEEIEIKHAEYMKKYYHKGKKLNLNNFTFKEYTEIFIRDYCEPNISKVTLKDYKQMLNTIMLYLGNKKLNKITSHDLDIMYNTIRKGKKGKELAPKTMSHYYNLMSLMFKQAKKWKYIEINPNEDAVKPKLVKRKRNCYDKEQVMTLLKCLNNENIKYRTIIALTLKSGIRRSELCALRWNDIDFINNTIYIDNSLKVINGVVDEEKAKTEYSIRTIHLGNGIMSLLQEYKNWQDEYIISLGDKWQGTNRVFTSPNGQHMHPDTCSDILRKVIRKYDLPKITFHELRHTCASILNSNGIDIKTISETLGHSNVDITMNIYTHSFTQNKIECANVFDRLDEEINNSIENSQKIMLMAQNIGTSIKKEC